MADPLPFMELTYCKWYPAQPRSGWKPGSLLKSMLCNFCAFCSGWPDN